MACPVAYSPSGRVAVVCPKGDLDIASVWELQKALTSLHNSRVTVVDLRAVTFLDSTVMSVLVTARNRAARRGSGQLLVINPHVIVSKALKVVGLLDYLSPTDEHLEADPELEELIGPPGSTWRPK